MSSEFTCKKCSHSFNRLVSSKGADVACPRCGGRELEQNRYLLGTPNADEVTCEDYCDVALAPCCTPDWKGWRNFFYSSSFSQPVSSPSDTETRETEKEKLAEK